VVNALDGVVVVGNRVRWLSDDTIRLATIPWGSRRRHAIE
jgi:hypothetical protein